MFDSTEKEPKMVNERNTANRICGTCMCFHTISANAQKGLYVLQLTLTIPKKGSTELVSWKGCNLSVKTFCRYMKSEPAAKNNREKNREDALKRWSVSCKSSRFLILLKPNLVVFHFQNIPLLVLVSFSTHISTHNTHTYMTVSRVCTHSAAHTAETLSPGGFGDLTCCRSDSALCVLLCAAVIPQVHLCLCLLTEVTLWCCPQHPTVLTHPHPSKHKNRSTEVCWRAVCAFTSAAQTPHKMGLKWWMHSYAFFDFLISLTLKCAV